MKTLTGKERAKAYRMAAQLISNGKAVCCCGAIDYAQPISSVDDWVELFMFKPNQLSLYWWPLSDVESRILALLFMEQIALDSKN